MSELSTDTPMPSASARETPKKHGPLGWVLWGVVSCLLWVRTQMRRLYDWVLSWADTPYGTPALFFLSFAESSFFPIPPDVLQIALSAGKPLRSFFYATVSLVGSVTGALLGYFIGYALWELLHPYFYACIPGFTPELFEQAKNLYNEYGFLAIFTAATTPIPYKIFTIAAGVCEIAIPLFIAASIIGRGLRFYLVAALLYFCGPAIKTWIEKYFEILAVLFCVLLVGGFLLIKFLIPSSH